MLNIVAPLDYERWAVLVSPLLSPGATGVETKPPPRHTEQLGPVNAALSGTSSRTGEGLKEPVSRSMEGRRKPFERDLEHPLQGPHPADLNWFFQLPGGVRDLMQNQFVVDSRKASELYDHLENTRGTTLHTSG